MPGDLLLVAREHFANGVRRSTTATCILSELFIAELVRKLKTYGFAGIGAGGCGLRGLVVS